MKNKQKKGNKTQKKQYGTGFPNVGGLMSSAMGSTGGSPLQGLVGSVIGGGGMTGPQNSATNNQSPPIDIRHASEIAAKELIQKICQALNPPGSQVFLNIATNSLKTYLEGEDANKMMNEQLKAFINDILGGIINDNSQSPAIFRETFKTHQTHIKERILLPAIMKAIGDKKEIQKDEIEDLVEQIESNILELNRQ